MNSDVVIHVQQWLDWYCTEPQQNENSVVLLYPTWTTPGDHHRKHRLRTTINISADSVPQQEVSYLSLQCTVLSTCIRKG